MLRDRDIDDLIDIQEWFENWPRVQNLALQVHFLESGRLGKNDVCAGELCGFCDAGPLKAAARVVAAYVRHDDPLGSRIRALPDNFRDNIGIRVGRLLWRSVPTYIRLHQDDITTRNEAPHASQFFNRLARQLCRVVTLDDGHLWKLRIGCYRVAVFRSHGQRRLRTPAVLAEPETQPGGSGASTRNA